MISNKKGQVWVETVIYTLIGLALIGLVLTIATPKINKQRDKILVEQTIDSLSVFDEKINDVLGSVPGNIRNIPAFTMKKGEFYVNSPGDNLLFVLKDLGSPYSEPDVPIMFGNIILVSREDGDFNSVHLILNYTGITNLTYGGKDELKKFTLAATPYKFSIENKGGGNININEIS